VRGGGGGSSSAAAARSGRGGGGGGGGGGGAKHIISEKCDLWSFGAVTVQALSGTLPEGWADADAEACLRSFRAAFRGDGGAAGEPRLIDGLGNSDGLHEQLCALVEACLQHEPTCRPSAGDVVRSLTQIFSSEAVSNGQRYFRRHPESFLKLKPSEKRRREMVIARDVRGDQQLTWKLEQEWKAAAAEEARREEDERARRVAAAREAGGRHGSGASPRMAQAGSGARGSATMPPASSPLMHPVADSPSQVETMAAGMGRYLGKRAAPVAASNPRATGHSTKFSRMA